MQITLEQYSRKAATDLENGIARAVRAAIEGALVQPPGEAPRLAFSRVFDTWASYEQDFVAPAACVVPAGALQFVESYSTPCLLEETWEPQGEPGFGLYAVAAAEQEIDVLVRAGSDVERNLLVRALEGLFFEKTAEGALLHLPAGARYGRVLTMDDYYQLPVRTSLREVAKGDNEESAQRSAWEARVGLRVQAKEVVLGVVQPFTVTIQAEVVEEFPSTT